MNIVIIVVINLLTMLSHHRHRHCQNAELCDLKQTLVGMQRYNTHLAEIVFQALNGIRQ